jgi:pimeloyl-ACP methyl ester carboxylesterase
MSPPATRYAKSGDTSIAYQVVGDGPLDLVLVLGFATHIELQWESPAFARFFERISSFSRLIIFDKRGTGLSDPITEVPTLEQRVDDVRAVMDAAGSERAALFGISEGGPMSVLFAATHPDRVTALVLYGAMGRTTEAPDYPWASPAEALREAAAEFIAPYWGQQAEGMVELFAPSLADDPGAVEFTARIERSAASPAMVQQIFEMFLDIESEPSCPRSTFRRSSSTGAATGSSIAAPARRSPHRSRTPDTWSFPGSTICPGQATRRMCSGRSRSS